MPGLVATFSFKGWMALVWGMVLGPLGVLLRTVGLWRTGALPRWQVGLLAVSLLFVSFPDGAEIINLLAAFALAVALVPHGLSLITTSRPHRGHVVAARVV